MKNKKTYYLLILDQSGSMQDCVNETISGFNEQLQMIAGLKQRFPEQQFYVSLTTFNHEVNHPYDCNTGPNVPQLNKTIYQPDGSTALLDAIGEGVFKLKSSAGAEIARGEASAVVVILTDGYENASRFFDWKTIRGMIRELEADKLWSFSFLGATPDAIEIATKMNIRRSNAMHYDSNLMPATIKHLSKSFKNYAAKKDSGNVPDDFF